MRAWRRIRELARQNAELKRALDWYAVGDNWRRRSTHPKGSVRTSWELPPAHQDRGARARATLISLRRPLTLRQRLIRLLLPNARTPAIQKVTVPAAVSEAPALDLE